MSSNIVYTSHVVNKILVFHATHIKFLAANVMISSQHVLCSANSQLWLCYKMLIVQAELPSL